MSIMAYKQFIIFQTNVWLQIFDEINDSIPSQLYMITSLYYTSFSIHNSLQGKYFYFNKKLNDLKIQQKMFSAFHTLLLKQEEARIENVNNTYSFNCALKNKRC